MADDEYEVGYKKPPQHGKIRKGERRNPNGRRGNKEMNAPAPADNSVRAIFSHLEEEMIEFSGRRISKREAMLRVLQTMALKGDLRALKQYEEMRREAGIGDNARSGGGVLVVPGMVPLEQWSISAAIQQQRFREADYGKEPGEEKAGGDNGGEKG
jgi:hypothetical protein